MGENQNKKTGFVWGICLASSCPVTVQSRSFCRSAGKGYPPVLITRSEVARANVFFFCFVGLRCFPRNPNVSRRWDLHVAPRRFEFGSHGTRRGWTSPWASRLLDRVSDLGSLALTNPLGGLPFCSILCSGSPFVSRLCSEGTKGHKEEMLLGCNCVFSKSIQSVHRIGSAHRNIRTDISFAESPDLTTR